MTASFTASNGYTIDWRDRNDGYMTVKSKNGELELSEYVTIPTLRALIEFAEGIGIAAEAEVVAARKARPWSVEDVDVVEVAATWTPAGCASSPVGASHMIASLAAALEAARRAR